MKPSRIISLHTIVRCIGFGWRWDFQGWLRSPNNRVWKIEKAFHGGWFASPVIDTAQLRLIDP